MPEPVLGSTRLFKISGIALALGSFLEEQGNSGAAYEVYDEAFKDLKGLPNYEALKGEEKMRAVVLAQKSAEMAQVIEEKSLMVEAEERLGWAVAELLRLASAQNPVRTEDNSVADKDLELPAWISSVDMGASMENLGLLYLKQGNSESVSFYSSSLYNTEAAEQIR